MRSVSIVMMPSTLHNHLPLYLFDFIVVPYERI